MLTALLQPQTCSVDAALMQIETWPDHFLQQPKSRKNHIHDPGLGFAEERLSEKGMVERKTLLMERFPISATASGISRESSKYRRRLIGRK